MKFAQAVNVLVRGFQLAWPPLAYSIRDDDEARRAYAVVVTLFLAGCSFARRRLWLYARTGSLLRLAAPKFFDAYEVIGLISAAVTLYALYMVMVVILGRTGRTEFNLPAAISALVANVVLNLILVPPMGIVGAALALVASYLVVIVLMYGFTQRLFPVPYEWGRLARVAPHRRGPGRDRRGAGADLGLRSASSSRGLLIAAYPLLLLGDRLLHRRRARLDRPPPRTRRGDRRLRRPARPTGRGRRPRPRGPTKPSAWTRTRASIERPSPGVHDSVTHRAAISAHAPAGAAQAPLQRLASLASARSRMLSPRAGKRAWRAWAR